MSQQEEYGGRSLLPVLAVNVAAVLFVGIVVGYLLVGDLSDELEQREQRIAALEEELRTSVDPVAVLETATPSAPPERDPSAMQAKLEQVVARFDAVLNAEGELSASEYAELRSNVLTIGQDLAELAQSAAQEPAAVQPEGAEPERVSEKSAEPPSDFQFPEFETVGPGSYVCNADAVAAFLDQEEDFEGWLRDWPQEEVTRDLEAWLGRANTACDDSEDLAESYKKKIRDLLDVAVSFQ